MCDCTFIVEIRHAGEGGRREQAPLLPFSWGSRGAKLPFLNAMICLLIVNMIQRRSYKLKASNIWLEKTVIYMTVRGIAHEIPQKCLGYPPILGFICLSKVVGALSLLSAPLCPTFFPASLVEILFCEKLFKQIILDAVRLSVEMWEPT